MMQLIAGGTMASMVHEEAFATFLDTASVGTKGSHGPELGLESRVS